MHDHVEQYFLNMVQPTVDEFLRDPSDERRASLACLMLQSLADHYFHTRPTRVDDHPTSGQFRFALGESNFAYRTVLDIANATKHFAHRKNGLDFTAVQTNDIHCGNLRCDWPISGRYVMVETKPGSAWLVCQLVEVSMEMWRNKLKLDLQDEPDDAA